MTLSLILFFTIASVNLAFQGASQPNTRKVKNTSKALLMPSLCLVLFDYNFSLYLGLALVFSAIGDIFLIWHTQRHFLLGLVSFLLAHLAYTAYFFTLLAFDQVALLPLVGLAMIIAWYGIILYQGVAPKGLIRWGMPLYMLVIGAMLLLATTHFISGPSLKSAFMVIGALLFSSSDSVLAFRRIKGIKALPESYVMFSYISGQFLILLGHIIG